MSKLDEKVTEFSEVLKGLDKNFDQELLHKVSKGLGPALYNRDAAFVSTSDKEEVERLKKNFLIKKLGLEDNPKLDEAIEKVANEMGKSNPRKHRAVFYYLLTKHFGKEEVYN